MRTSVVASLSLAAVVVAALTMGACAAPTVEATPDSAQQIAPVEVPAETPAVVPPAPAVSSVPAVPVVPEQIALQVPVQSAPPVDNAPTISAAEVTRTNLQIALSTPCPEEDSTGCYWDASVRGNGAGVSFVAYTDYRGEQVTLQIG